MTETHDLQMDLEDNKESYETFIESFLAKDQSTELVKECLFRRKN